MPDRPAACPQPRTYVYPTRTRCACGQLARVWLVGTTPTPATVAVCGACSATDGDPVLTEQEDTHV
jgi:hypothetical protein